MWFARAVPRVNLLPILIKLAILIYFDCVPAISIAILISRSISIYFNHFDLFRIISIYFDSFRFISIPTSESPKHFDGVLPAISIIPSCYSKNGAWWLLLPPHFCLFHSHYAGIWHIMADMKIQWWKSGKTTINQWEGRVILQSGMKNRCGPIYALSRLLWPFFLCTYYLLGSL
jgi:hypothetical protein